MHVGLLGLGPAVELGLHQFGKLELVQFKLLLLRNLVFHHKLRFIVSSCLLLDELSLIYVRALLVAETRGSSLATILEWHLLHGHLHAHGFFKLHLL